MCKIPNHLHNLFFGRFCMDAFPVLIFSNFPYRSQQCMTYDRWEIPFSRIHIGEVLGEGAFGKVVRGKIEGRLLTHYNSDSSIVTECMKSYDVDVAVKMLHGEYRRLIESNFKSCV